MTKAMAIPPNPIMKRRSVGVKLPETGVGTAVAVEVGVGDKVGIKVGLAEGVDVGLSDAVGDGVNDADGVDTNAGPSAA